MREDLVGWLIREMRANTQDHRLKAIRTWNEAAEVYREERRYDLYNSANNAAALMWTILVGPGMEWDYKGLIRESVGYGYHYAGYNYFYDVWANINYGYAGRAGGFTSEALLKGAGSAQAASDLVKYRRLNFDESSHYDDPADQAAIRIGMALYDDHRLNIDEDKFREAFLREASHLLQVPYVRLHGGDANAR